jgi:hypothetical protein
MARAPSKTIATVSIVLAGTLAAVGCGGSGDAAPLTRAQFIDQANAICSNSETERSTATREAAGDGEEAAPVTKAALQPVQQMAEELGDLGPPAGDEREVEAIIASFEKGIKKLEASSTDLVSTIAAFERADELADEYGLTSCAI